MTRAVSRVCPEQIGVLINGNLQRANRNAEGSLSGVAGSISEKGYRFVFEPTPELRAGATAKGVGKQGISDRVRSHDRRQDRRRWSCSDGWTFQGRRECRRRP